MLLAFTMAFMLCSGGCNKAASVALIGGADGPTAIFVSSDINWLGLCVFAGIIVVIVLTVLVVRRNKKK